MARKFFLSIFFISFFFLIACDTPLVTRLSDGRARYEGGAAKLSTASMIEGYVIDARTGKGIGNAKVEIKNANMGVGYYVRETGYGGYFKIEDFIPYVNYIVEISADGYVTYTSAAVISEGKYKYKLMPEAILSGVVRDTAGMPLKGVEVKLKKPGEYYREQYPEKPLIAATDAGGAYRFAKLPGGSYIAPFTYPGYITETAQLKYVKEGENFSLPLVMVKPATIAGRVMIAA